MLDEWADTFHTAYQFAVKNKDIEIALSSGIENHKTGAKMTNDIMVPLGSQAKAWTAMNVLRLVEKGELHFNTTIPSLVDDFLHKTNGSSILQIWDGDKTVEKVTLYNLLHMSSGFHDHDNIQWTLKFLEDPQHTPGPLEGLYLFNKTFVCQPGTCSHYSDVNYIVLGLVLAQHAGLSNWKELDQMHQLPKELKPLFKNVKFIDTLGKKYNKGMEKEGIAHTYYVIHRNQMPGVEVSFVDLMDYAFIDGCWTCGNIVTNALDDCRFFYEYLATTNIVSKKTHDIMQASW